MLASRQNRKGAAKDISVLDLGMELCNRVLAGEQGSKNDRHCFLSSLDIVLNQLPPIEVMKRLNLTPLFQFERDPNLKELSNAAGLRFVSYLDQHEVEFLRILKGVDQYQEDSQFRKELFQLLFNICTTQTESLELVENLLAESVIEFEQLFQEESRYTSTSVEASIMMVMILHDRSRLELLDSQHQEALKSIWENVNNFSFTNVEALPDFIDVVELKQQPNPALYLARRYVEFGGIEDDRRPIGKFFEFPSLLEAMQCWKHIDDNNSRPAWIGANLEEYLWYERLEAGSAEKLAQEFGILNPARYPRSLLEQQIGAYLKTDLCILEPSKRSHNSILSKDQIKIELDYILVAVAHSDWSNAFSQWSEQFELWASAIETTHQLIFIEMGSLEELALRSSYIADRIGRKAAGLHIFAHGSEDHIVLGLGELPPSYATVKEIGKSNQSMLLLRDALAPDVQVILHSCSAGSKLVPALKNFLDPAASVYGFNGTDYYGSIAPEIIDFYDQPTKIRWNLKAMSGRSATRLASHIA